MDTQLLFKGKYCLIQLLYKSQSVEFLRIIILSHNKAKKNYLNEISEKKQQQNNLLKSNLTLIDLIPGVSMNSNTWSK